MLSPMYDPFQEYSVKRRMFVCLFLMEWSEIQATSMQTIQRMVYITKSEQKYC